MNIAVICFLVFLSGLVIKILLMCVSSKAITIIVIIRNSSYGFLFGVVKVFGSSFKAFKLQFTLILYLIKEDTHKNYNEWQKSQYALLIFEFFL